MPNFGLICVCMILFIYVKKTQRTKLAKSSQNTQFSHKTAFNAYCLESNTAALDDWLCLPPYLQAPRVPFFHGSRLEPASFVIISGTNAAFPGVEGSVLSSHWKHLIYWTTSHDDQLPARPWVLQSISSGHHEFNLILNVPVLNRSSTQSALFRKPRALPVNYILQADKNKLTCGIKFPNREQIIYIYYVAFSNVWAD